MWRKTMLYSQKRSWLYFILSVVLIPLIFAGSARREYVGTITETGSTTVYPLAKKLAEVFMEKYPNVSVTTEETGSGTGIKSAMQGSVDIGASSRELKAGEEGLHRHLIGQDGIAIIVHPSNPIDNLTLEQVVQVFSGDITTWSDLGGDDIEMTAVIRAAGSGTRAAFEGMVMGDTPVSEQAVIEQSNADVRTIVSINPQAIGYLSFGFIDSSIKPLAINNVAGTPENCRNGSYPVVRPLYFLTRDEPEGIVKEFIEFSLSREGQKIVRGEGYLSVR
jgi:phosphate transport system substrate-binding protein